MKRNDTRYVTRAAAIAALYTVLTLVFQPISYGSIQFRVSEALTVLPFFTPAAVPGLFLGCLSANLLGGAPALDVIFGSLATLIGAAGGYLLRSNRWLVPLPAVAANTLIIPFVLRYGYGVTVPIPLQMLYILAGEIGGCCVLGQVLASILMPVRGTLFGAELETETND